MKVLGKTLACKYLSIYTVCLNHKAGAAGYATDPLCLFSRLKRPSKGEQGPRHFNPCCFAFPRCGSVPMFAGRGPSCRVPGRALTLPAASAAPWEPQHVTGQKNPERWSGEVVWGSPRFLPHVKGFLCAGAPAGKEHQGGEQAHTKTAGASGRKVGGTIFLGQSQAS